MAPATTGGAQDAVPDDLSTLAWVLGELRRSLEAAHKSLRRHLKEAEAAHGSDVDGVDVGVLRAARTQLHQGVGALELVGLSAPAQVLRASEAALARLVARPALVDAKAVDVIERVSFAVLDFLQRQLAGKPVSAVSLFPQYRAAQQLAGADRVHPADLWLPAWRWLELPADASARPRLTDEAARSAMEGLVLILLRQPDQASLMQMSDLCADLGAGARQQAGAGGSAVVHPAVGPGDASHLGRLATLWQLAAAVFEAQAGAWLGSDVYSKRLASRLLTQLRGGMAMQVSERLAQDLLFFCAHARVPQPPGAAPRLLAVRRAWALERLPTADYDTPRLGRFDPAVIVQARKRMAGARDAWSAVAGGERHRLQGLGESFSLLGDSVQRLFPAGDLLAHALQAAAEGCAAVGAEPPAPLAMEVATAMLYLDACLEDGEFDHPELGLRVQHLAERIRAVAGGAEQQALETWMEDLYRRVSDRQTMGSVVHELRASLSEVEKQIDHYFRQPAAREVLIPVPAQLSAMRGVFSVLGLDAASQAVVQMRDEVEALAQTEVDPQRAIQAGTFDRLADNLGALSFLIDTLAVQPALARRLFQFDADSGSLRAVMGQPERVSAFAPLDVALDASLDIALDQALDEPVLADDKSTGAAAADIDLDLGLGLDATSPPAPAGTPAGAFDGVPDLASAHAFDHLPAAAAAADDAPPLQAQAQAVAAAMGRGDFDEAELLRRLETLAQQAAAADESDLARRLGTARRALVAATDPAARDDARMALVAALADLAPPSAEPLPPPAPLPPERVAAPGSTGLEDDAEMRDIFLEEAREVVAEAGEALQRLGEQPEMASDMTVLRRAFHTLKGSARMVGLRDFGEAAWACEQLYNARLAQQPRMDAPLRQLTTEALAYLGDWTEAIARGTAPGHRSADVAQAADALRQAGTRPSGMPPSIALPVPPAELPPETPAAPPAPSAAGDEAWRAPEAEPLATPDAAFAPDAEPEPEPEPRAEDLPDVQAELQPDVQPDVQPDMQPEVQPDVEAEVQPEPPSAPPPVPADDPVPDLVLADDALVLPAAEPALADIDLLLEAGQDLAPLPPDLSAPVDPGLALPATERVEPPAVPGPATSVLDFSFDLADADPVAEPATGAATGSPSDALIDALQALPDAPMAGAALTAGFQDADEIGRRAVAEDDLAEDADAVPLPGMPLPAGSLADRVPGLPSAADLDLTLSGLPALPDDALPALVDGAAPAAPDTGFEIDLGLFAAQAAPATTDAAWSPVPDLAQEEAQEGVAGVAGEDPPPLEPVGITPLQAVPEFDAETEAETEAEAEKEPEADAEPAPGEAQEGVKQIGELRIAIPLFNIFLNEADEQSRRLCTALAEWALEHERRAVPDDSISLAHSLAGNSATVGYAELSALARALEHALMRSQTEGRGRDGEAGLFTDVAEELRRLLHQFAAGFLRPVPPELLQRLSEHERLPALSANSSQTPLDALDGLDTLDGLQPLPAVCAAEAPGLQGQAGPVNPLAATLLSPEFVSDFVPLSALPPLADAALPVARPDAFDDDEDIDATDAIDTELFPIFEEEAEELLPQLQSRLRDWLHAPADSGAAAACMRTLHTLKGGARLAGAMRLGEMAHRLETAIEHLLAQEPVDPTAIEALLARGDAMSLRFEALRHPAVVAVPADGPADVQSDVLADTATDRPAEAAATPVAAARPGAELEVGRGDGPGDGGEAPLATGQPPVLAPDLVPGSAQTPGADRLPQPPQPGAKAPAAIDWSRFSTTPDAAQGPALARVVPGSGAVRVRAALLDRLVNNAGEVSITRARIGSEMRALQGSLGELTDSLERLRRQLRDIELQAETQMSSRLEAAKAASLAFDPLEMDRFTRFQELTRFMAESVNDVATLQRSLQRTLQSTEDELAAQARLTRELQDDLLRTRMVEFESLADRLYRTVRQAAKDAGKSVRLDIVGGALEVDRGVLERMVGPFEHLLRNAVAHGIEAPGVRTAAGKDASGRIVVSLAQAGNEVAVEFADDGAGLDLARIRSRAVERGLLAPDAAVADAELAQLIFAAGFSTADVVTELAGRGVGMDVVRAEVTAMGGRIETASAPGQGTRFRLLLPLTTAVTQVVMLRCGDLSVAVPSTLVEVVRRVPAAEVEQAYAQGHLSYAGEHLPFFWLAGLLQAGTRGTAAARTAAVVVVRSAAQRVALHVDDIVANQEVVVKNVGPQLARVPGLVGVTLLPSGAVTLIYNPVALAAVHGAAARARLHVAPTGAGADGTDTATAPGVAAPVQAPLVLVVDDSLTVRRVTQRLLLREGFRVTTAKDGMEALERLAQERPAVLLSDIEMPRMDGFDLLRNVRADPALQGLPVIMITSRTAQKHRDLATQLGADHYLGKPYGEEELLSLVAGHAGLSRPDLSLV